MIHVLLKGTALGLLFAYISSGPFIFETHFGHTQTIFGCIMGANALLVAGGSMLALKFRPLKSAAMYASVGLLIFVGIITYILFRHPDSFWGYELLLLPILFCLGMIFTVSNTLAMNEGRNMAGDASALLGIIGYIFGASVSPLVGQGNIMHSTGIAYCILAVLVLIFGILSYRLAPDLTTNNQS